MAINFDEFKEKIKMPSKLQGSWQGDGLTLKINTYQIEIAKKKLHCQVQGLSRKGPSYMIRCENNQRILIIMQARKKIELFFAEQSIKFKQQ